MYLINYQNKWWYKSLTILVILAILFMISFGIAPKAKAIAVLTATTAAVILAVLAGVGIATVTASLSSNDIQSWLNQKLNEWDTYRNDGNIFTDLIDHNLFVMTVKGLVAVGNSAAVGITDFINWLVQDLSITDNSSVQAINGNINLNGYNIYPVPHTFSFYGTVSLVNDEPTYIYTYLHGSSFEVYQLSPSQNIKTFVSFTNEIKTYTFVKGGIYYGMLFSGNTNFTSNEEEAYANNVSLTTALNSDNNIISDGGSLSLQTDVIGIPDFTNDTSSDIIIGIGSAFPGITLDDWTDEVLDGVIENTLDTTMTVTDEFVDAVEAVVINEQPISVNTDHHMIGFVPPSWSDLNLSSIWHYVEEAIEYSEDFIYWFVHLIESMPILSIPLYMSFTLMIVIFFIRRIVL